MTRHGPLLALAMIFAACAPSMPLNPSDMTAEQIKAAVADKSYSMGCAHTETPYKIGTIFLNFDKGVLPAGASGTVKINADCSVEWTVVGPPKQQP